MQTNAAFRDVFGERTGEPCYAAFKQRDAPCDDCAVMRTFADRAEHVAEERGRALRRSSIHYRVRTIPMVGADGAVALVLQMATDTTRLLDLSHSLEQAEQLARVGLTMAGMAHTIKNILSGLEGGRYLVASGIARGNTDRVEAGWSMVDKYIEQIGSLVHNLLRYTRMDEDRREDVDPARLADDVVEMYRSRADLAGVDLVREDDGTAETIRVDRGAMHSCLANLVSNAIDACQWDPGTEKDHRVVVTVRQRPAGGCTFVVEDNGMGIGHDNQARVLASSFTTKGIRGTGLGLLLSRKSVEQHGGQISFSSTEGVGTTFRVDLPRGADHEHDDPGDR